MDWKTYMSESSRTFAPTFYLGEGSEETEVLFDKLNQLHCAIGISTEIAEFMEAVANDDIVNGNEELGDILWYTANLARITHTSAWLPIQNNTMQVFVDEWLVGVQELLDHYKKAVYYGSDVDKQYVATHIQQILTICCGIANNTDTDIHDILDKNINKLRVRYPEKFTQDAAENRNLDAERDVLK
jgi:NTP pyrophosphatase (non-canonical NTP hydrolase)